MTVSSDGGVISLPPAEDGDSTETYGRMPALVNLEHEPVGRWFEALCRRRFRSTSVSYQSAESSDSSSEEEDIGVDDHDEEALLRSLDPKEWKDQDHYAVLGLVKVRYRASDDQIKRAYKRMVLRHHPDKRRARGIPVKEGEEDYFTCITRAYEVLGVPSKRRSYDSVDPTFEDWIPSANLDPKEDFYSIYRPVFERNARWSTKKRVPELGDDTTSFESVDHFYAFWYDFDSWREYSYLDEEDKEKGENREERRWIEKQNKAARQKRKKEETARIRQLVDNAYGLDPRILKHKEAAKQKKLAEKQAKRDAARAKVEEEERIKQAALEEERKKKEKEEEEARIQAAIAKKEKEALKKALKKEKKIFRTTVKEYDYFTEDEARKVAAMQDVEKLAEMLSVTSLQNLNESLTSGDKEKAKSAFCAEVHEMNVKEEEEKRRQIEIAKGQGSGSSHSSGSKTPWTDEEIQTLIKAVNLFPAGTTQRWETVANFITQHISTSKRSAKEVLAKAKDLQRPDANLKEEANKKAFQTFSKDSRLASASEATEISERYDSIAEQQIAETGTNPAPWSADEQKRLEQGLKTYPASVADRWEKISEVIPTRSKKDCMKRYKELVEMIRAKKAAQAAAASKKK